MPIFLDLRFKDIYLAIVLSFVACGVKNRFDCCVDNGYNDNTELILIECTQVECSGLEIGCFIAVLTYTLNLFGLLDFRGSVYNAVVKALVELRNLLQLLAEDPDLVDSRRS